jgi:hypothetical protein
MHRRGRTVVCADSTGSAGAVRGSGRATTVIMVSDASRESRQKWA